MSKSLRLSLASMALAICMLAPAPHVASPAAKTTSISKKEKDIRRLLEMTGAGELGIQVLEQLLAQFQQSMPEVPASFWVEFKKDANANALVDLVVPIYDRHFSQKEIQDVIRFYQTPSGRKLISKMPVITQESIQVGQKWGEQLGRRVIQRLQESQK